METVSQGNIYMLVVRQLLRSISSTLGSSRLVSAWLWTMWDKEKHTRILSKSRPLFFLWSFTLLVALLYLGFLAPCLYALSYTSSCMGPRPPVCATSVSPRVFLPLSNQRHVTYTRRLHTEKEKRRLPRIAREIWLVISIALQRAKHVLPAMWVT